MDIEELEKKHCVPCEGGVDPLDEDAARRIAKAIDPMVNSRRFQINFQGI